ncbi:MAG: hypothetical protein M1839_003512 [Geoglossum umbratile]|nr:MAG: hypothetical protein M1839_003512 [Geoglossum umbratile]
MPFAWLVPALCGWYLLHLGVQFLKNLQKARSSGIPYIIVPVNSYQVIWYLSHRIFIPLLRRLPVDWTGKWIDLLSPGWAFRSNYGPFRTLKTDVILTLSPFSLTLWLAHPQAITQVTTQRAAFPKDTEMYKLIELFDHSIVTTEGDAWQRHRKFSARGFGDNVHRTVWGESKKLGQRMLDQWLGSQGRIDGLESDMMELSLEIMWRAGFGIRRTETQIGTSEVPHPGNFKSALETVMAKLFLVATIPHWLLARSPVKTHRKAVEAHMIFEGCLKDLIKEKREVTSNGDIGEPMDILGSLLQGASATPGGTGNDKLATTTDPLTDSEIMANTFMSLFAGHESTASTIYFTILLLALNPQAQQSFQSSLDALFSQRPPEQWDYDHDLPKLSTNMPAAVMNEGLRLMPPFMYIPKIRTAGRGAQAIMLDGKNVLVPDGCQISIVLPAVHRNPNCWPVDESVEGDLDQFRPERWLVSGEETANGTEKPATTTHDFYRPPRGAFLPFSDGPRSCIGRRFAQIEILAFLSTIFCAHSVELSVSNFATDAEVAGMPPGGAERKAVWEKSARRAEQRMGWGIEEIGLGLCTRDNRRAIEFKLVKRGEERFRGF